MTSIRKKVPWSVRLSSFLFRSHNSLLVQNLKAHTASLKLWAVPLKPKFFSTLNLHESWNIFLNKGASRANDRSFVIRLTLTNCWHHRLFVTPLWDKEHHHFWDRCNMDRSKSRHVVTIPNRCIPSKHTWSLSGKKKYQLSICFWTLMKSWYEDFFWSLTTIWVLSFWTFCLFVLGWVAVESRKNIINAHRVNEKLIKQLFIIKNYRKHDHRCDNDH